ncbi:sensor histidine kinase [Fluviicola taffensis]|uniref:Signal transduction histidine kinase, LytS n=1 Tax=Fluviicola taffensis (strain DSM 16823 / NCIMB 13979 / RW262) TaxID=755732 RepID=F2IJF0_FLUTR|nr:histidine kinase [Fluviicola taffensis]AEA42838.1 signal transduction histidine kinase, LytS [Fluviicola taffensis DSM 16823]
MFLSREKRRELLQFNDNRLRLFGIPILSIIIMAVFFDTQPFNQFIALTITWFITIGITTVFWHLNRAISIYVRLWFKNDTSAKRYFILFLIITFVTVGFTWVSNCISLHYSSEKEKITTSLLVRSYVCNLLVTYMITAIYETVYFFKKWQQSNTITQELKIENYHTQLNVLKANMSPHFLFNSLNTLASIVPKKPELAQEFIQNLSQVYRYILEMKDEKTVSVSDEMNLLNAYLFLLNVRFEKNISLTVNVPNSLYTKSIVPLSLQILIENVVKHNVISSSRPLIVTIYSDESEEYITVKNNLQPKRTNEYSSKFGHISIIKRYQLVSNKAVIIDTTDEYYSVSIPLL